MDSLLAVGPMELLPSPVTDPRDLGSQNCFTALWLPPDLF